MTTKIAEAKNKYNKRIEDLIEDAEIEAEIEAERKIRSKHTKLFLISAVGLGALVFIYLGVSMKSGESPAPAPIDVAQNPAMSAPPGTPLPAAYVPEPKPIPFPVENKEQSAAISEEKPEPAPRELPPVLAATPNQELPNSAPDARKATAEPEKTGDDKQQNPVVVENGLLVLPEASGKNTAAQKSKSETKPPAANPKTVTAGKPDATKKSIAQKPRDNSRKLASTGVKAAVAPATAKAVKEGYVVQVGAFSVAGNADVLANKLRAKGLKPVVESKRSQTPVFAVFVGEFADKRNADEPMKSLQKYGFKPKVEKTVDNAYTLVIGEFKFRKDAESLQDKLGNKGFMSGIRQKSVNAGSFIVQLGGYATETEARSALEQSEQLGFKGGFIRKES